MQATATALRSTDGSFIDANNAKQMPSRRNAVAYIWRTLRAGFGNTALSKLMKLLIVQPVDNHPVLQAIKSFDLLQ